MADEKRLIDANRLLSVAFLTIMMAKAENPTDAGFLTYLEGYEKLFQGAVNAAPTVDAVEVVRCKDCKYSGMYCFGTSYDPAFACLEIEEDGFVRMATAADPEGYCSKGEKRNGD